jgi:hypothetical protein
MKPMDRTDGVAAIQSGLIIAIIHLFKCLHQQGVLSLEEGSASLRATAAALPAEVHPATRELLTVIADGIQQEGLSGAGATEAQLATQSGLTVIPGGKA